MSIYYLETSLGQYSLDATIKVKKTLKGSATSNIVESGESITDHYVNLPDEFSLDGIISDLTRRPVKGVSKPKNGGTTKTFIKDLTTIKESGEPIKFFFGDAIDVAESCLIEQIDLSQTKKHGAARGVNSFLITIKLKKIRLANAATFTHEPDPAYVDKFQETKEGSGSSTEETGELRGAAKAAKAFIALENL